MRVAWRAGVPACEWAMCELGGRQQGPPITRGGADAGLIGADLRGADLSGARLTGAKLDGAIGYEP